MQHITLFKLFLQICIFVEIPINQCQGNRIPHHRKVRQIRPQDVVTVSEEKMAEMDPEQLEILNKEYTREFFRPLNKRRTPVSLKYFLDKNSFLREPPFSQIISDIPGIEEMDFDQHVRQQKGIHFQLYLKEQAEKKGKKLNHNDGAGGDEFLTVNLEKMLLMLNNVFTLPRSYRSMEGLRTAASDYISQKLGNLGLIVGIQYFFPSRFYHQFVGYDPNLAHPLQSLPPGANVFGILPGTLWGTSRDRLVIIGAHWDTMDKTDGYNDNGSGVAAVLEVARQIVESHCRPKNTIIFATFDLEEMGGQGSNEFVKRYLIPQILRKYGQSDIGGAFIADTIMNLNRTINSQEVPKEWNKIDPNTAKKIEENDLKGDFLAIFQRRQPDASLVSIFSKHWNYLQQDTSNEDYFKLRPFRLDIGKQTPTLDTLSDMVYFVRSDHSRFWIANETDYSSFPAILLTDTGPSRGKMIECYHNACDSVRGPYDANFANMEFYQQIVQTLLNSIIELSKSQCLRSEDLSGFYSELDQISSSSTASTKNGFFGSSLLSLTEFIRQYMPW